jgi:uncharacterized protein (DUF58 family)
MTQAPDVLTTRGRAFLAAGLTLLTGGLVLGITDITRVGVLLSALPLLAYLFARSRGSDVVAARTVHPPRLVVDQSASVAVVLQNTSGRRTRLQLAEERVDHLLGNRPRFVLPAMEPGEIREVRYEIRSQVRGRHRLGPLTLRRKDPYGLATTIASPSGSTDILVLPRTEVLGRGGPRANGIGVDGAIAHMVALHGEDDVAIRSYREGDDLRRIHWPSTAHRCELMVRQEDRPASRRAVIVLDSRAAGHQGSGTTGSFEWAVTATASIAAHLSGHQYTLHLATSETTAGGHAAQTVELDEAMASLAMAQPGASQQFDEVLRWARPMASTGALVIAIAADHDEATLRRIAALRQPTGTGLMILLDTASFTRPRPAATTSHTLALSALVGAAGWSTFVADSGMTVAMVWDAICAHSAMAARGGR